MRTSTPRTLSPRTLRPMYASIGTEIPGTGWVFEPKYDGVRVLAFLGRGGVSLMTRNGRDKSRQFPEVVADLENLQQRLRIPLVLDGELVALERGRPARFQALQSRLHVEDADAIAAHSRATPAALFAFDVLQIGDEILLAEPWTARRSRLESLLKKTGARGRIRLGGVVRRGGAQMLEKMRASGWEGMIAKRADAPYRPGKRSDDWRKLKVEFRQELVVGGWTEPRNSREHIGALLLGYYDEKGRFVYAGHTGGGFTQEELRAMAARLRPLERSTSPFAERPKTNQPAHWTRPSVVVEVKFTEWTSDGKLRHPIYLGTRDDKPARAVRREKTSVQKTTRARPRRPGAKKT